MPPLHGKKRLSSGLVQSGILITSLFLYAVFHYLDRPTLAGHLLANSLPSFLFPLFGFSLIGILPKEVGGYSGNWLSTRFLLIATFLCISFLEVLAPTIGRGTSDIGDIIALSAGCLAYSFLSFLAGSVIQG